MQRLIIYTYYVCQSLLAVSALIEIELAIAGSAELTHLRLWWLQAFKSSLVVSLILTSDPRANLSTLLYLPQLVLDSLFLATTSLTVCAAILSLGLCHWAFVVLNLKHKNRRQKPSKPDMRTSFRHDWFQHWNRSCITNPVNIVESKGDMYGYLR
jgi:hypothetical protein